MSIEVRSRTSSPRQLRWFAIAMLLVLCAFAAPALELDDELRQELAQKQTSEWFDVFIALDRELDERAIEGRMAKAPQARRAVAIDALRAQSDRDQAGLLERLGSPDLAGHVREIRRLWICNGIALRVDREALALLEAAPLDGAVLSDAPREMLQRLAGSGEETERERTTAPKAATSVPVTWSVDYIRASEVWDLGYDGSGVLVAHFDTGIWMGHPDIANRIWTNPGEIAGNGIDDDQNGYIDDVNGYDFGDRDSDPTDDGYPAQSGGHGTHTAGSVAGDGTSGLHTGVAPGATLMACKVSLTESGLAPISAIWEGWQYALENGAHLVTMSMGSTGGAHPQHLRAQRQVGDAMRLAGVAAFVASGNSHGWYSPPYELTTIARVPSPWHPDSSVPYSSRSGVIAVGATKYQADEIWLGSSQGPADWGGVPPFSDWDFASGNGLTKPDLSAPGESVASLSRPTGYTAPTWSGTSMACPHAAGVAALLLQKNPSLSPEDLDRILQQTAVDAGAAGKDNAFGSGRIDALAAIQAVPASQLPSLVIENLDLLDPDGDGYFEPGETVELDLRLFNNSRAVAAANAQVQLSCSDPFVTVIDPNAGYGNLSPQETSPSQLLRVAIDPAMPQGQKFDLLFTLSADGGFTRVINQEFTTGLPELRTHQAGAVRLSVTDRGTLGFWDDGQGQGIGFAHEGGYNGLTIGGLWAGTGPDYVCNRDFVSVDPGEWVVSEQPNGRLREVEGGLADEDFVGVFTDQGHPFPRGIQITQHSMAFATPGIDEFVVLRYEIFNTGSTLTDFFAGLYCDFDIIYPLINNAAVDPARRLSYMWDIEGNYFGIALLEPTTPAALALIPNADFSTTEEGFSDQTKWDFLSGSMPPQSGVAERDYSSLVSAGPFTIPRTKTVTIAFALVYGDDLAELRAHTDAALAMYGQLPTPVPERPLPTELLLAQNIPNPFNPSTEIRFELPRATHAELTVFDLRGRFVRTLLESPLPAGPHVVQWDGRDAAGGPVSSGQYLYRLQTAEGTRTRKMVLVQ